jgi:hypothetical protein
MTDLMRLLQELAQAQAIVIGCHTTQCNYEWTSTIPMDIQLIQPRHKILKCGERSTLPLTY